MPLAQADIRNVLAIAISTFGILFMIVPPAGIGVFVALGATGAMPESGRP